MPRRMPPLNALRAFEAAGRHESFSDAADELGVSHSAISKHVRGLEDRLGAQLFTSHKRGVALTPQGRHYLEALSPAFDAIAEASEEFEERPEGTVIVNAENVFGIKCLVGELGDFYAENPGIEIELVASDVLVDMDRYAADIAIRFYVGGVPDRASLLLSDAPLHPYASPVIAEEIGDDPARIMRFRLFCDRGGDPWGEWFRLAGLDRVPEPRRRMRALLAMESAIAGQGVFLASEEIVARDVALGLLVKCSDIGFRQGSYHMIFSEGVQRRKPVRIFRDWLLERTAKFREGEDVR